MTLKDGEINFLLKVRTTVNEVNGTNNPIDITLDLNPHGKLITIAESFSTKKDLIIVFERIAKLLETIDDRSSDYSKVLDINTKARESFPDGHEFSPDAITGLYDSNFKPPFEKIDKIIYRHNSPGIASVSYARSYNGDKKPTL